MGAGAAAPAGVGSSPAPIGGSFAGAYPAVTPSVSPVAPAAPQQPYVNPFMQTYGQNNTPQQQMFNRFQPPQQFRQPVAQPAQGPVYADQSLNAPGNQPQQYSGQPQYGRFGRGFMPQNRFGYDRQMDQLRGGYNRPMPPMMQGGQQQIPYSPSMAEYLQDRPMDDPRYRPPGATPPPAGGAEAGWQSMLAQSQFAPGTDMVKAKQDFMQRYNSRPQQPGGQPSAPAGGKGGNPTAQPPSPPNRGQQQIPYSSSMDAGFVAPRGFNLPPPPNQDGTPGSWSTYI